MNSKATRARFMAFSTESSAASQGRSIVPGPNGSLPGAAERVPIGHAEAEVVLHRLAFDHFVFVVVVEGQRVLALGAFEADLFDSREMQPWFVVSVGWTVMGWIGAGKKAG